MTPSGSQWCREFAGSASLADLAPPFQGKTRAFIAVLETAGAKVTVSATFRPPERAYLMHWCWAIARGLPAQMCRPGDKPMVPVMPSSVPPMAGVDIDWGHGGDYTGARVAAEQMLVGYGMKYCAALASRHTERLAVDMDVAWRGIIEVKDARGIAHACQKQEDLWPIGASFGVFKLPRDEPHWSSDGH